MTDDGDEQFPFRDALRKALIEAIEQDQAQKQPQSQTQSQRVRSRRHLGWALRIPVVGAAAAALLVVVLLGVQLLNPGGSTSDLDDAVVALQRVALNTPVPPLNGGYLYSKIRTDFQSSMQTESGARFSALLPVIWEQWLAADGSGRQRFQSVAAPTFASTADELAWIAAGSPPFPFAQRDVPQEPDELLIGRLYVPQVLGLPTEPSALRAELEKLVKASKIASSGSLAYDMLDVVVSGLLWLNPQPELRAALFAALGGQPGVEVQRDAVDELGRPGVALWVRERGMRTELIVEPATAQILGVNYVVEDPVQAPRQQSGRLSLIQTGVVEGTTEIP